jgi:hypothetical protein
VGAGAVTACQSPTPYAAVVEGHQIPAKDLDSELTAMVDNAGYSAELAKNGATLEGKGGKGTYDQAFVSRVLTRQILLQLVKDELDRKHVALSPADLTAGRAAASSQLVSSSGTDLFKAFPASYQNVLATRDAELTALQGALGIQAYYDAHQSQYSLTCASHILVATQPLATQVKAQLDAGGDFAAIAKQVSTDAGSKDKGGDLGCNPPGAFVAQFDQAAQSLPVGKVSDPIQTQFGFHIIKVVSRQAQPLSAVKSQVGNDLVNMFLQDGLKKANVQVNPRYGTIQREGANAGVVPPVAPGQSVTTPPARASGSGMSSAG